MLSVTVTLVFWVLLFSLNTFPIIGTQPRRFPVEGGDSSVGLEPGLSSSAACNGKEIHCLTITDVPITVYATMRKPPAQSSKDMHPK
ncbi:hypothetical protein FD754_011313 [Muntiacus muntjak]|uniref:Protein FAM229B n=1 Tax=Muntiacus muntjak TaxID=9888 RepID=A0A5N3VDU8_MUNMU|nr:hypothetical protein FD754_011313 [Muntiacus muntjak]